MSTHRKRIRVENLPTVSVLSYNDEVRISKKDDIKKPFRILFIKPYQKLVSLSYGPPLGILLLASGLRDYFGNKAHIDFWDMNLYNIGPEKLHQRLREFQPDVIAVSAVNFEANASYRLAELAKEWDSSILTVIGGPFTLRQSETILKESRFDWCFEGAADRTFVKALERYFSHSQLAEDLPGFSYRKHDGSLCISHNQDLIEDIDSIPLPAWDLLDFDRYSKSDRPTIATKMEERRYAFIFSSRGCPYLCNYCHDTFTKKFVYRSDDNVIKEMDLLYHKFNVKEFHFVDDIFNLHKPRVLSLMKKIKNRFPEDIYLAFPNGLRGDILDKKTIDAMVDAGTYYAGISIETVSPRLQGYIEKNLDIEKAKWAIDEFAQQGVIVQGAFMVGFPTETIEEIKATIRYAIKSKLTHAYIFHVIPQPQTPIFDIAIKEAPEATLSYTRDERRMQYNSPFSWYQKAYGFNLEREIAIGYWKFYLHPWRAIRLLRLYNLKEITRRAYIYHVKRLFRLAAQKIENVTNTFKSHRKNE